MSVKHSTKETKNLYSQQTNKHEPRHNYLSPTATQITKNLRCFDKIRNELNKKYQPAVVEDVFYSLPDKYTYGRTRFSKKQVIWIDLYCNYFNQIQKVKGIFNNNSSEVKRLLNRYIYRLNKKALTILHKEGESSIETFTNKIKHFYSIAPYIIKKIGEDYALRLINSPLGISDDFFIKKK